MNHIKKVTLGKDVARGVRFLNESSYSNFYGVTRYSLEFVQYVFRKFEVGEVVKVEFKTVKNNYRVYITTSNGFTIVAHGLSFGYFGEGSRGSREVLELLGFSEKQISKVFSRQSNFRLYRRVA